VQRARSMANVMVPQVAVAPPARQRAEWRRATRTLIRNRLVLAGLIMVLGLIVIAVLAGLIAPYDPIANNVRAALQPPSSYYYFGTDRFGRDVLSRVVHGSRLSLFVAIVRVTVSAIVGVMLGLISGYYRGWIDNLIGRAMDVFFSFPALLLAIAGLRARRQRAGPGRARQGVRRGRAGHWRLVADGVAAPRLSERALAADRPGHDHALTGDPGGGVSQLPGPRDAAAVPFLGDDAPVGSVVPGDCALDEHLPRRRARAPVCHLDGIARRPSAGGPGGAARRAGGRPGPRRSTTSPGASPGRGRSPMSQPSGPVVSPWARWTRRRQARRWLPCCWGSRTVTVPHCSSGTAAVSAAAGWSGATWIG